MAIANAAAKIRFMMTTPRRSRARVPNPLGRGGAASLGCLPERVGGKPRWTAGDQRPWTIPKLPTQSAFGDSGSCGSGSFGCLLRLLGPRLGLFFAHREVSKFEGVEAFQLHDLFQRLLDFGVGFLAGD